MKAFHDAYLTSLRTPEEGADTICWLATTQKVGLDKSGEFFRDRDVELKNLPLGLTAYDAAERDQLWKACKRYTGWKDE